MKNVYDIMHEDKKLCVISDKAEEYVVGEDVLKEAAIGINLYYEDRLPYFFSYIDQIPSEIAVYIFSSNPKIYSDIEERFSKRKNVNFVKKENRGRDISALLVAFRKIALERKYVCFVHDKKEKTQESKEDTDHWLSDLWDNTLKSSTYIKNILGLMERDNIGLMIPPKPVGECFPYYYLTDLWRDTYPLVEQLAEDLKLNCVLQSDVSPIAIGTAFWCRVDALRKLFEKEWEYNDFPEEPLSSTGTISHAIERIFPYVAQDAGYDTRIALCNSYAEISELKIQRQTETMFDILYKEIGLFSFREMEVYFELKHKVEELCEKAERVYIYGAGKEGKKLLKKMRLWKGCRPDGFVVSDGMKKFNEVVDVPIFELGEISKEQNEIIFIAAGKKLACEMEQNLLESGFVSYFNISSLSI